MTLKELENVIASSNNSQWYLNYTIKINSPLIKSDLELKGVPALYDFILRQIQGFEKFNLLPREIESSKNKFIDAKDKIISLVKRDVSDSYEWGNCVDFLRNGKLIFFFDVPETEFLILINEKNQNSYQGAFRYITNSAISLSDRNIIDGCLLAYEFANKNSLIAKRSDLEEKSLSELRSIFQKKISEAETMVSQFLTDKTNESNNYTRAIDTLKDSKTKLFEEWYKMSLEKFDFFFNKCNKDISQLEELYKAKLKLEGPAKYWNDRAKRLRREGYYWLMGLVGCIGIAVTVLIWVLGKMSSGAFANIFSQTGPAVKWSIAMITLISFLAFLIRTFSKLTFSSFHLVRDAEEREQLTYVYLALQKERGIDQTERHLIMQSLFSRADSGLLKDDASPTMPGNIADKLITK